MRDFLNTLLASLDTLEVKGKQNLDVLLGCMMAVEKAIAQLEAQEKEPEETERETDG